LRERGGEVGRRREGGREGEFRWANTNQTDCHTCALADIPGGDKRGFLWQVTWEFCM